MASYEEDALSRVAQMHSKVPQRENNQRRSAQSRTAHKESPDNYEQKNELKKEASDSSVSSGNLLTSLFQNDEQSLILLLIVLLMEENAEPVLLLALLYLLL